MKTLTWDRWLRANLKDPRSPVLQANGGTLPGSEIMGALTGQDSRALGAISRCWELYACSDEAGQIAALVAVGALLPALQPQCRCFARELIAMSLDWSDRDRLWRFVTLPTEGRSGPH